MAFPRHSAGQQGGGPGHGVGRSAGLCRQVTQLSLGLLDEAEAGQGNPHLKDKKFIYRYYSHICSWKQNWTAQPQPAWPSGLSIFLQTERSLVRFLVGAHAWVAGSVPQLGRLQKAANRSFSLTWMVPSLSFFLPSPLSK